MDRDLNGGTTTMTEAERLMALHVEKFHTPPVPELEPPSSAEITELNALVAQFVRKSSWVGNPQPVFNYLRPLLARGIDVSAAIEKYVVHKMKPWASSDLVDPPPEPELPSRNKDVRHIQ